MNIIIGVIGALDADDNEVRIAEAVGREIAARGCMLLSGGMGGVMEASCRGAKSGGGTTIGIIPGESKYKANKYVDIPIVTGMGHGRNIIVARSSDAVIAIGGGYGTLTEIAFALRLKIPVIGLNTWDVSSDIKREEDPIQAVDMAVRLGGGGS